MIENAQKNDLSLAQETAQTAQRVLPRLQARRLSALEIAEGALLADIGVVFHLLVRYLPIGGNFLGLLIPVVFAVLVLRRGLYVGCMSLCVSLFIISIMMGPGGAPLLLLEAGAGLFLGVTMRRGLSHFLTIVLGVICGALGLWSLLLFYALLGGGTGSIQHGLSQAYYSLEPIFGAAFHLIGLGNFWQQRLLPLADGFIQWGLQHWLLLLYLFACAFCTPLVIAAYWITNFFLRLLGYQVRPFPGYRLEGLLYGLVGGLLRLLPRAVLVRVPLFYNLKCEVRRLNMARLRQHKLAKEARKTA